MGFIEGGQALNVIPEMVRFGGTFRSMTSDGLYSLQHRIKEVTGRSIHLLLYLPSISKSSGLYEIALF